jgi:hypothetical protein
VNRAGAWQGLPTAGKALASSVILVSQVSLPSVRKFWKTFFEKNEDASDEELAKALLHAQSNIEDIFEGLAKRGHADQMFRPRYRMKSRDGVTGRRQWRGGSSPPSREAWSLSK